MSEKSAIRQAQAQARGCPDDCNIDHPLAVFARLHQISRAAIYRLKKEGRPVIQTRLGPRVNFRQARDFFSCLLERM